MLILNNFLQERWLWQKSGCGENLIRGLLHFLSVSHPENCFHFFLSRLFHIQKIVVKFHGNMLFLILSAVVKFCHV